MTTELHLLWDMSTDTLRADPEWERVYIRAHSFPCGHLDESYVPMSIPVTEPISNLPLTLVFSRLVGGDIIRSDLKERLSPEILEICDFGEVLLAGEVIPGFELYEPRTCVELRGNKESFCIRCTVCGQIMHSRRGQPYILRKDIPAAPIFGSSLGLVITTPLRERLRGTKWRKLGISQLKILDKPRDGFPEDLQSITPEQERSWAEKHGDPTRRMS